MFLAGDDILKSVYEILSEEDFENEAAGAFWGKIRDIISASKPKKVSGILVKIPTQYKEFIDRLYFIDISPSFSDKELWAQEIIKIAGRIKRAALARGLSKISQELSEAQRKGEDKKVGVLSEKFDELSKSLINTDS